MNKKDDELLEKLKNGVESGEFTVKESGSIKLNLGNPDVVKKIMKKANGFSIGKKNSNWSE